MADPERQRVGSEVPAWAAGPGDNPYCGGKGAHFGDDRSLSISATDNILTFANNITPK